MCSGQLCLSNRWSLFFLFVTVVLIVCTVPLPPGVNPIAVDKYIYIYLVMSGQLAGVVLSVIMFQFQYSLKLSSSSTLAGLYLH